MPIFERIKIVGRGAYVRVKKSNAQQFSDASLVRTIKRTTYLSYITLIMVVAVSVAILLKPSPQIPDVAREVSTMQRV